MKLTAKLNDLYRQRKELLSLIATDLDEVNVQIADVQKQLCAEHAIGYEQGTFNLGDGVKVVIRPTYLIPKDQVGEAFQELKGLSDDLAEVILPSTREFSKSGWNVAKKSFPEEFADQFWKTWVTTKMSAPSFNIKE